MTAFFSARSKRWRECVAAARRCPCQSTSRGIARPLYISRWRAAPWATTRLARECSINSKHRSAICDIYHQRNYARIMPYEVDLRRARLIITAPRSLLRRITYGRAMHIGFERRVIVSASDGYHRKFDTCRVKCGSNQIDGSGGR